jgi:hypothetical protein
MTLVDNMRSAQWLNYRDRKKTNIFVVRHPSIAQCPIIALNAGLSMDLNQNANLNYSEIGNAILQQRQ